MVGETVDRGEKGRIEGEADTLVRVVSLTSVLFIIIINSTLASLTTAGYVVPWSRKGVSVKRRHGPRVQVGWK